MFFLVYFRQIDMEMTKKELVGEETARAEQIKEYSSLCQDFIMQKIDARNQ